MVRVNDVTLRLEGISCFLSFHWFSRNRSFDFWEGHVVCISMTAPIGNFCTYMYIGLHFLHSLRSFRKTAAWKRIILNCSVIIGALCTRFSPLNVWIILLFPERLYGRPTWLVRKSLMLKPCSSSKVCAYS